MMKSLCKATPNSVFGWEGLKRFYLIGSSNQKLHKYKSDTPGLPINFCTYIYGIARVKIPISIC